jgi:hypothetical protein
MCSNGGSILDFYTVYVVGLYWRLEEQTTCNTLSKNLKRWPSVKQHLPQNSANLQRLMYSIYDTNQIHIISSIWVLKHAAPTCFGTNVPSSGTAMCQV